MHICNCQLVDWFYFIRLVNLLDECLYFIILVLIDYSHWISFFVLLGWVRGVVDSY